MAAFADHPALRDHWYAVARSSELDAGPVGVTLLGEPLVLWCDPAGDVVAAPDRCPHREAPLSAGTVTDGELTCCYHGWCFGEGGACVRIPSADPATPIPPAAHLSTHRCQEAYGLVWVCPGEPAGPLPCLAQEHDPRFRRINTEGEIWAASTTRMVDNFLDIAHFPWVHAGTFGGAQEPRVDHIDLEDLGDGWFGYVYEVDAGNPAEAVAVTGSEAGVVHRWMSTGFHLPFTVRSTIRYQDGLEHILLLVSTPVDDLTSWFTFVVWRNDDFSVDPEEIIAFDRAIGAEDKAMLEQVPGTLPLARTGLVSVQADKPSVAWRRQLAELLGR